MAQLGTYLSVVDVAVLLGIRPATVYNWVRLRQIPHVKVSGRLLRFDATEIMAWINEKKHPVQGAYPRKAR
ncbi:MAG: helix-turn-helix domain-containing protein [Syntrophorhabdales bacterium]|jgi:excisionase family DNA binding protein